MNHVDYDLVVILRDDTYLRKMTEDTEKFFMRQNNEYLDDYTKKTITCAYSRSHPFQIDHDLIIPTYKIAMRQEDREKFCDDIRNIMGIQRKKEEK